MPRSGRLAPVVAAVAEVAVAVAGGEAEDAVVAGGAAVGGGGASDAIRGNASVRATGSSRM